MQTNLEHPTWTGNTGGLPWMQRSLLWICAKLDIRFSYAIMGIVIVFYMIFCPSRTRAQYHLFRHVLGYGFWKTCWSCYQNFFTFGSVILDRFAVYGGRKYQIEVKNEELYHQFLNGEPGFVQISSHIGNFEMAGYLMQHTPKTIHALVFSGETQTVQTNRAKVFGQHQVVMVPVQQDMSHVFILNDALRNGQVASMPGDRLFGSSKSVECQFMGRTAHLPIGPFMLAVQRELPIVTLFVMKEATYQYTIYVNTLPTPDPSLKKREQVGQLAQAFAHQMEEMLQKYPLQWFNYFDFWNQGVEESSSAPKQS